MRGVLRLLSVSGERCKRPYLGDCAAVNRPKLELVAAPQRWKGGSLLAIGLIRIYQRAAPPSLRRACRFTPSCSEYTAGAIERYGVVEGARRGLARLARCRPPYGSLDEP